MGVPGKGAGWRRVWWEEGEVGGEWEAGGLWTTSKRRVTEDLVSWGRAALGHWCGAGESPGVSPAVPGRGRGAGGKGLLFSYFPNKKKKVISRPC